MRLLAQRLRRGGEERSGPRQHGLKIDPKFCHDEIARGRSAEAVNSNGVVYPSVPTKGDLRFNGESRNTRVDHRPLVGGALLLETLPGW